MTKNQETARLFYLEILKIHKTFPPPQYPGVHSLYQLLHTIFMSATEQERVPFNTFFARVAFAFQKYEVPPRRQIFIHQFRRQQQNADKQGNTNDL